MIKGSGDMIGLTVGLAVMLIGCGGSKPNDTKAGAKPAKQIDDDDPPIDETQEATFANPKVEPPKAPDGSIALRDPWLYVQTCAEPHPCETLEQPAGDAACRELRLGNYEGWRLPSKDEVPRFQGVAGLEATAGYHWTRTPFDDDLGQVWIVDPSGEGPATTIPRDRKPFLVRCVKEP